MNTEFERYMVQAGYKLTGGKGSDFNTYDNCNHSYSNGTHSFIIGLIAGPTRIGMIIPSMINRSENNWERYDKIPVPADFKIIKDTIEKKYKQ